MNTSLIRRLVLGLTLTVGGLAAQSTIAAAADESTTATDGVAALRMLCEARKGSFYITPFALARCQEARGVGMGFELERNTCENGLGATFTVVRSYNKPNRATWVCA
jgi:hypothetical protein